LLELAALVSASCGASCRGSLAMARVSAEWGGQSSYLLRSWKSWICRSSGGEQLHLCITCMYIYYYYYYYYYCYYYYYYYYYYYIFLWFPTKLSLSQPM